MKNSTWNTTVANIHTSMNAVLDYLPIRPDFRQEDAEEEIFVMQSHEQRDFVWMVSPSGSTMIPLRAGFSAVAAAFRICGKKQSFLFHVSPTGGIVEQIDEDYAMELVRQFPVNIADATSANVLVEEVSQALESFDSMVFEKPNYSTDVSQWQRWLEFFDMNDRIDLGDFMHQAITKFHSFA